MLTINYIGTMMFDGEEMDSKGRLMSGTLCFIVIIPIFAIRRYLYTRQGDNYRFYASAPVAGAFAAYNLCVLTAIIAALTLWSIITLFPNLFQPKPLPPPAAVKTPAGNGYLADQARAALANKDWAGAITYAEISVEDPACKRSSLEILGKAHLQLKHFDKARAAYQRLLKIDPKNKAYRAGLKAAESKHS